MKPGTIIKLVLIPFIGFAIYQGHKNFFNTIPERIKSAIPVQESSSEPNKPRVSEVTGFEEADDIEFKFSPPKGDNSLIGNAVSGALNKVLENPNGRLIVKEVFQKMATQSQELAQNDLFLSRYLAHDVANGSGNQAMCGDKVEILYSIQPAKDATQVAKELKTTLVLGMGTLGINFENGIIGMAESGKRNIVYPEDLNNLYKSKSDGTNTLSAALQLLSIKEARKSNGTLGKPFFDKVGAKYVTGLKLICGDMVQGSYTISDLDGKVLYDSKKAGKDFLFRIGEDTIPYELSDAIMGLPIHKADASFITSYQNILDSFSKSGDFLPKNLISKTKQNHLLLNFKLAINKDILNQVTRNPAQN